MAEQKIPIHNISAPASAVDGDKMAVDHWAGGAIRMATDTFDTQPLPAMQGQSISYQTFGGSNPPVYPTQNAQITKFPFATHSPTAVGQEPTWDYTNQRWRQAHTTVSGREYLYNIGAARPISAPYNSKAEFTSYLQFSNDSMGTGSRWPGHAARYSAGSSSTTKGYIYGGDYYETGPYTTAFPQSGTYDKVSSFPFADATIPNTDVTELGASLTYLHGTGNDDTAFLFNGTTGNLFSPGIPSGLPTTVRTMPYASETISTSPQSIEYGYAFGATSSSPTHGYRQGGQLGSPSPSLAGPGRTQIVKFAFTNDTFGAFAANLGTAVKQNAGTSSGTDGYSTGGHTGPAFANSVDHIQKFPFAADADSTDVGEISTWGNTGNRYLHSAGQV